MKTKIFPSHREMRLNTLLQALYSIMGGATSKREVQKNASLSWGAVSNSISMFLEKGLIVVDQGAKIVQSRAGRTPANFTFNNAKFLIMGLSIQADYIRTCLINLGGELVDENIYHFENQPSPHTLNKNIKKAFTAQLEKTKLPSKSIIALSFSLTGAVDSEHLIWINSPHYKGINNYDFNIICKMFNNIDIYIEHDIKSRARSVLREHAWEERNYVFFHFAEGVGMTAHSGIEFYNGARGLAGEIGHIPYLNTENKHQCLCGKYNCIESFLSTHGFLYFVKNNLRKSQPSFESLIKSINYNEKKKIYKFFFPILIHSCLVAINLFDPETLIIGGKIIEPWYKTLEKSFDINLRKKTWLNAPEKIKYYYEERSSCAYGATLGIRYDVASKLIETLTSNLIY